VRGKIYKVHLTADEKKRLEDMVTKGVHPVREITYARILLLLNQENPDRVRPKTSMRLPALLDYPDTL
jgi:hypothetical protein